MANLRNFFITFCICLVVFSLAAASIVKYFTSGGADNPNELPVTNLPDPSDNDVVEFGDGSINEESIVGDTFSVIVTVLDNEKTRVKSACVIKADKQLKNYWFMAYPMNMLVPVDNVDTPLSDILLYHDRDFFYDKLYAITGVEFDYRLEFTESGLSELIDNLGGLNYNVPQDMVEYGENSSIATINLKQGNQTLNGRKLIQLLRFSNYENGVQGMCATQTSVAKSILSLISSAKLDYVKENISLLLGLADTDFTAEIFAANEGMISSYANFIKTESQYPGHETESDNGTKVFIPDIESATSRFRQYR